MTTTELNATLKKAIHAQALAAGHPEFIVSRLETVEENDESIAVFASLSFRLVVDVFPHLETKTVSIQSHGADTIELPLDATEEIAKATVDALIKVKARKEEGLWS